MSLKRDITYIQNKKQIFVGYKSCMPDYDSVLTTNNELNLWYFSFTG